MMVHAIRKSEVAMSTVVESVNTAFNPTLSIMENAK
jgi:hypothetical protein